MPRSVDRESSSHIVSQVSVPAIGVNERPSADSGDPRKLLLRAPMSRFQWLAVAVSSALCALEGFDVMAINYAAPALLREWGISKVQLGYVLSSGLLGMAVGSLLLSPLADSIGRRRMIFVALVMMIAGSFWTAVADGMTALMVSRVLTGVGVGSMIGIISTLAAEYANARHRDTAVSVATTSYGLGAILSGLLSAWLLASFGWRSIFFLASALGLLMVVVVWRFLLEPLAFVVARPGSDGLARTNRFLRRCGHPPVATLPPPAPKERLPLASLFRPDMIRDTLTLTAIFFFFMIPLFYVQTWVPTLMTDIGLEPSEAAVVAACVSFGSVCPWLLIAAASQRIGLKRLQIMFFTGVVAMILVLVETPANFALLTVIGAVTGFCTGGSIVGLWAIVARTFPGHLRASGTGFVVGIGRFGSTLPPILAGLLFTAGVSRTGVSLVMVIPAIVALALLFTFRVRPPDTA